MSGVCELSAESVRAGLGTRWMGRGAVLYAPQLPSTNAVLRDLARQGAPHGSVAVCHHQTAGRGRMSRSWEAPAGEALTFSVLLRPRLGPEQAQLCTLAAAVSVAGMINGRFPGLKARIKWPNDVVVEGRKVCGILSEAGFGADGLDYVVTGVGLNVNQPVFSGELADKAASLLGLLRRTDGNAQPLDRAELLRDFLGRFEEQMDRLEAGGFAAIRPMYEELSATIGQAVQVIAPAESYTGTARGVDETGALLVERLDGTIERVLCGDVSVRGLMGYV